MTETYPGSYGDAVAHKIGRNAASTWTQSGHLEGRTHKTRVRANPRPASVAYALYLASLEGLEGDLLFESLVVQAQDAPTYALKELAREASQTRLARLPLDRHRHRDRLRLPRSGRRRPHERHRAAHPRVRPLRPPAVEERPLGRGEGVDGHLPAHRGAPACAGAIQEFALATTGAGHRWKEIDLTPLFARWMADNEYREQYFKAPQTIQLALGDFATYVADRVRETLEAPDVDENTVVALIGAGSLFGLGPVRLSKLVEDVEGSIKGRLLVFFPGERDGHNYRLLDARDGWSYLAIAIDEMEESA